MQKKTLTVVFCFSLILAAGCIDAPGELALEEDTTSAAELELAELELAELELVEPALMEPELSESELAKLELAESELAGSDWGSEAWECEGWNPPKFQHCLTRCTHHTNLHPVGSEYEIPYGQCHERADKYCRNRGSWVNDVCWGSYY